MGNQGDDSGMGMTDVFRVLTDEKIREILAADGLLQDETAVQTFKTLIAGVMKQATKKVFIQQLDQLDFEQLLFEHGGKREEADHDYRDRSSEGHDVSGDSPICAGGDGQKDSGGN